MMAKIIIGMTIIAVALLLLIGFIVAAEFFYWMSETRDMYWQNDDPKDKGSEED